MYMHTHTHKVAQLREILYLCLVMIIPCISCMAPTMYTARFEPAEQVCAPHVLNIYIYINRTLSCIYIYIPLYIYIELCKYKCVYSEMLTHTYMYKYILYISQKKCGKVAQPRNTQLRHFLLGHHCPRYTGLCSPNM